MPTHFDDRVFEAIALAAPQASQDLAGILHYVDSRERLILTHEELVGSLERLTGRGAITELRPHRFTVAHQGTGPKRFTPISRKVYDAACDEYAKTVDHKGLARFK